MVTLRKMRQKLIFPLLILTFSIFASQKLLNPMFYTSHDGPEHVIRMEEFSLAFSDGQIPVRLAKRINHGLGYPFFNFDYPLVYYSSEFFHRFEPSFVDVFKTLMIASVIIGGLSVYYFCLNFFGPVSSFGASLLYIFAPYRLLDMYVRGDVAESIGLALIPLCLCMIEIFIKKGKILPLVLSFSALILSHNISALLGFLLYSAYFLFRTNFNKKLLLRFSVPVFLSLLICSFFLIPALFEAKYTRLSELSFDYKNFFPQISEIFYSKWGFGQFVQGKFEGKMSPQIGIIHSLLFGASLLASLWLIVKKRTKQKDKIFCFFICVSFISFFLALPVSKPLWDSFLILRFVQIPWRFVGYIILGISICSAYLFDKIKMNKLLIFALLLSLLYASRNQIRINQYVLFSDPFKISQVYEASTTSKDEHMPIWAPRVFENPNPNGDIIKGIGEVKRAVWKSNYHEFELKMNTDGSFRDNTSYYPGWTARLDGKKIEINYKEDTFGRLLISVPKGSHKAEFFFGETKIRLLSDFLSLFGFLIVFVLAGKHFLKNEKN